MGATSTPWLQASNAPVGSGTWGDYNNDGWLDLFSFNGRRLFRNDWASVEGTGFTEIALPQNEFPPSQNARGASWGDHDNDGDLDLYQGGYAKPVKRLLSGHDHKEQRQ